MSDWRSDVARYRREQAGQQDPEVHAAMVRSLEPVKDDLWSRFKDAVEMWLARNLLKRHVAGPHPKMRDELICPMCSGYLGAYVLWPCEDAVLADRAIAEVIDRRERRKVARA